MKMRLFVLLSIIFTFTLFIFGGQTIQFKKPTSEEFKLHRLINNYRASKNLPSVPLSRSLSHVAQLHVRDLSKYPPRGRCNMHSWSPNGPWTACCYTSDHAQASCMWNKPRELTNYTGYGFECSQMHSAGTNAVSALRSWQGSTGHNAVIINQGMWSRQPWKSIGVGIYKRYAVIWFGREKDPDGYWEN